MKKVLWIREEMGSGRNTGILLPADKVDQSVYLGECSVRIWDSVPGTQQPEIPAVIEWDGEEYESVSDMDWYTAEQYLDSLVGSEGRMAGDWEPADDVLAYVFDDAQGFGSPSEWEAIPTYGYFCDSNWTVISLEDDMVEYEIEILDSYNLDFLSRNDTDFEFGGMGNHAILHKIRLDGDETDLLLWHEWSQWQGDELNSGELLTASEAMSRLSWPAPWSGEETRHPEYADILAWLQA